MPASSPELRWVSSRGNPHDYVLREKTFSFSVFLPPAHCWQNYLSTTTNPGPTYNAWKLLWLLVVKFPSAHFVFNTLPNPGLTSSPKHQRGSEFQWLRMRANMELRSMLWDSLDVWGVWGRMDIGIWLSCSAAHLKLLQHVNQPCADTK